MSILKLNQVSYTKFVFKVAWNINNTLIHGMCAWWIKEYKNGMKWQIIAWMHDHLDAAHNNISDISIAASDNHCFHIHII